MPRRCALLARRPASNLTAWAGDATVPDEPAVRRATALVAVVLCLLAVADAGDGSTDGGAGEVPMAVAMVILPLLYVSPATRPWWLRHRYLLLAVQAVLTWVPFALFGQNWAPGPLGWLAGLVLLTVPSPATPWLVSCGSGRGRSSRASEPRRVRRCRPGGLGVDRDRVRRARADPVRAGPGRPSSRRCTPPGTSSPRRLSPPSGSGQPTACGPRSATACLRRPGGQPPPCGRSPGARA